jgi:hypothetical protein
VPAEFESATGVAELSGGFADVAFGTAFGDGDARAALGAKERGGDAGAGEADYQHSLAFEIERRGQVSIANAIRYLSFKVVNENSANSSAKIQNRTITFDSLHPASSKW